mmetsp:Transcript_83062/g.248859  ORF Transcript_83062/g.248859 Transcript_83062/m.248859 type:complete len:227 (-) Transcript_83062:325-1005(-)
MTNAMSSLTMSSTIEWSTIAWTDQALAFGAGSGPARTSLFLSDVPLRRTSPSSTSSVTSRPVAPSASTCRPQAWPAQVAGKLATTSMAWVPIESGAESGVTAKLSARRAASSGANFCTRRDVTGSRDRSRGSDCALPAAPALKMEPGGGPVQPMSTRRPSLVTWSGSSEPSVRAIERPRLDVPVSRSSGDEPLVSFLAAHALSSSRVEQPAFGVKAPQSTICWPGP